MREKKHEEHENHERWLVSYADFITLLFAFFVVLYATSTQNTEKEKKFEKSLREKLKLAGEGSAKAMVGGIYGNVIDPIDVFQRPDAGNEEIHDYVEQLIRKSLTQEEREAAIEGIRHDRMGVRISLAAANFFPSGSAKLLYPALKSLDKLAAILKMAQRNIIIEGHTDDQAVVGGAFETNWELASVRASTVVRYLIKVHQLDSKKIGAMSYGDQRPLVANDTDEHRAKNRRIEILIVNNNDFDY